MAKAATKMKGVFLESFANERFAELIAGGAGDGGGVSGDLDDRLTLVRERPQEALVDDPRADLLATIHEQIIPQLMVAHFSEPEGRALCPDARLPPSAAEVTEFTKLALEQDVLGALAFIESMVGQGLSMETIFLQLVAEAARQLGEDWESDLKTFVEVTLALATLQQVVHVLGPSFAIEGAARGSVVLVSAPSEQHTLGIYLLGEFLRRAGWGVQVEPQMSRDDLIVLVQSKPVDMVGISVSNTDLVEPLARLVSDIKRMSVNADVAIMIGGALELAECAEQVGATFCNDPRDAVRWLDQHVTLARKDRQN